MAIYFVFQLILILTMTFDNHVPPTEQKPELLLYNQDTFFLYGDYRDQFPLGGLFLEKAYKEKLDNLIDTTCWSSGCAREFKGVWSIFKNRLYLKELQYCCRDRLIPLQKVFKKGKIKKRGVKAFWVTKELSVSDRYSSFYDYYFLDSIDIKWYDIKVEKGKVEYFKEEKE